MYHLLSNALVNIVAVLMELLAVLEFCRSDSSCCLLLLAGCSSGWVLILAIALNWLFSYLQY